MNKKAQLRILGIFGLVLLLSLVFVGAGLFNEEVKKSYDGETKTVKLKDNKDKEIADIQLLTPLNNKVGIGYQRVAEFKVSGKINFDKDFYGDTKTYDKKDYDKNGKSSKELNYNFDWKYLDNYELEVPTMNCTDKKYINGTNYTDCQQVGTHLVERERWLDFDKNTKIKKDDELIIGLYTNTEQGDYIEWIPTIFGVEIEEWATWTADLNVGLVAYYKLDEASGNAIDSLGINNLTRAGNPTNVTGKIGSAKQGSLGNLFYKSSSSGFTADTNTIGFWFKGVSNGNFFFFNNRQIGSTAGMRFFYDGSTFYPRIDSNGYADATGPSYAWTYDTDWHYVTAVFNDPNIQFWFDGVNVANGTWDGRSVAGTNWTMLDFAQADTGTFIMDEVGMWNRTLSGAEITQLYNNGDGITYTNTFNTVPTLTANVTKPDTVYTNTNYLINITATDQEETYLNVWTKFYINDVGNETAYYNLTNNTNELIATLDSSNFVKTDTLIAEVIIGDGTENVSAVNLTEATIQNSAPTTPTDLSFTSPVYSGNNLTATASGSTDLDSDSINYYYEFYNTNATSIVQAYSTQNYYTTQTSDEDDTITIRTKASDLTDNSSEYTEDALVIKDNAPSITINSPLNQTYETEEIIFNITATDSETSVDTCQFSLDGGSNITLNQDGYGNITTLNLDTSNVLESVTYYNSGSPYNEGSALKYDISSISTGKVIQDVEYCMFISISGLPNIDDDVRVWRINNQSWTTDEGALIIDGLTETNQEDKIFSNFTNGALNCLNVTNQFLAEYNSGNQNLSIKFEDVDKLVSNPDTTYLSDLRIGNAGFGWEIIWTNTLGQSYLNVTYLNTSSYYNYTNSSMTQGQHNVVYSCNDSNGNWNITEPTYFEVSLDTCTYSGSGDWNIDLADNCVITDTQDASGNSCTLTGSGSFTIDGGNVICKSWNFIPNTFDGTNIFSRINGGKRTILI